MYATLSSKATTTAKLDNRLFSCPARVMPYKQKSLSERIHVSEKDDRKDNYKEMMSVGQVGQMSVGQVGQMSVGQAESKADGKAPTCSSGSCGSKDGAKEDYLALKGQTCGGGGSCGNTELYPVLDPQFNMREAIKNMILLEDHLFHTKKICRDCIIKHFLLVLGFLEEGVSLDRGQEYTDIFYNTLESVEKIFQKIVDAQQLTPTLCNSVGQEIRQLRKPIMQQYGTFGYGSKNSVGF